MRAVALVALLVAVPLSGCIAGPPGLARHGLFAFDLVDRSALSLVAARGCDDLLEELNDRAMRQARVHLEQAVEGRGYSMLRDGPVAMAASDAAGSPGGGTAAHAQVTGTNNQEAAADEADLVKTDGQWTYVLSRGVLRILHSRDVGDVALHASVPLGEDGWGWSQGELLLVPRDQADERDDRLLAIIPTYGGAEASGLRVDKATSQLVQSGMTRIVLFSLEDRARPAIIEETWIEGSLAGARLVDTTAYVVVQAWERGLGLRTHAYPDESDLAARGLDWDGYRRLDEADQVRIRREVALAADAHNRDVLAGVGMEEHLPVVVEAMAIPRAGGTAIGGSVGVRELPTEGVCRRVLASPEGTGRAFTTIRAIAVGGAQVSSSTTQVAAGSGIVYASGDSLVLAAPTQDPWWFWAQPELEEATDLHWFDLDGLAVTLRASGRVPGIVQDSFGIDVHADELRVATTTGTWGRWWLEDPEPMLNHVAVFAAVAGQLVPKGIVGGLAPGERIWSARFTDERAYLVTFRNVDPLWVIDLSGPAPRVLGELEIPGVSTYIHPLDDGALLAIGHGPGPGGEGLDWGRIQVSLFDIADPTAPQRADLLDLTPANGWSWSSATHEHNAFTYWDAVGTLAVPVSTSRQERVVRDGAVAYEHRAHVGLKLVDVDRDAMRLAIHGEVDQDHLVPADGHWGAEVQRSYFLGFPGTDDVSVYAVSPLGVTAHSHATLRLQGSAAFPQPTG